MGHFVQISILTLLVMKPEYSILTHCGREKHICVSKLAIIGSMSLACRLFGTKPIIWTNAGILLIGHLWTNFSEILSKIHTFSFNKMNLKVSARSWPFCLSLNELNWSIPLLLMSLFLFCKVISNHHTDHAWYTFLWVQAMGCLLWVFWRKIRNCWSVIYQDTHSLPPKSVYECKIKIIKNPTKFNF